MKGIGGSLAPRFFETPAQFRAWLRTHHLTARELWVGFRKKATGLPSLTWSEAVDEALCFGWIDGIRKRVDADSYMNRFTPRRKGSVWSPVNTRRAAALVAQGRMRAAGRKAFEARDPARTAAYALERSAGGLEARAEARFRANAAAWAFFQSQPPGYRRMAIWFVASAKREETRARRLEVLISASAARRRLEAMQPARAKR